MSWRNPADEFVYVLHAGLAPLPRLLGGGRRVPVAAWVGERFSAVMVVEEQDDGFEDQDDELFAMVYIYRRTEHGWESSNEAGGFPWPGGMSNTAVSGVAEREVFQEGGTYGSDRWSCRLVEGFVGEAGHWVEIDDGSVVDRRVIHPSKSFVAVHQGDNPATVRVLDEDGEVLGDWDL